MREAPYHVFVGRVWQADADLYPCHDRSADEMDRFKVAFSKTMQA